MKAPVGLLSDKTVLRSKMEGPRPDKFRVCERSAARKAPVGLSRDRTVLRSNPLSQSLTALPAPPRGGAGEEQSDETERVKFVYVFP